MGWLYVDLDTDAVKRLDVHQVAAILIARVADDYGDMDVDAVMSNAVGTQTAITVPGNEDGTEALLVPPDANEACGCAMCAPQNVTVKALRAAILGPMAD